MLKSELAGYMEIFHCGEQYAAVSRELEMAFGIKGAELRALINALRRDGVPICSNEKGYFYAETDAELLRTIRHMSSRIAGITEVPLLAPWLALLLILGTLAFAWWREGR